MRASRSRAKRLAARGRGPRDVGASADRPSGGHVSARAWSFALTGGALVLAVGITACRRSHVEAGEAPSAVAEPPVPVPEGMLAEAVLASPNAMWSRVQRGVGGALGMMPSTFGGLVCALGGLDPGLGPEIDGGAPAYLVLAGGVDAPSFVLAVHLVDPRHARAALAEGDVARFTAREAAGMTVLSAKGAASPVALGLTRGGFLILAREVADLERVAPYAYRTLPTRPLPASDLTVDVPGAALRGAVRAKLSASWDAFKAEKLEQDRSLRAQHGGRAPDFGDPRALMASLEGIVQRRLAEVGDLASARLALDAEPAAMHAVVTLRPADGDGPARAAINAMRTGDLAPLLASPADAPLAFVWRDDPASRARDASDLEGAVARVLGARMSADDARKLHTALDDGSKGRGEWISAALAWRGPARGIALRASATDAERLSRAVREGLELVRAPAFREPLRAMLGLGDVTLGPLPLGLGTGDGLATFTTDARSRARLTLAWTASRGELRAALGEDAVALLAAGPARALSDEPAVRAMLAPIEATATFALVAQPLRLASGHDGAPAEPIVVAWGRRDGDAWARVDAADALVRELIRSGLGL